MYICKKEREREREEERETYPSCQLYSEFVSYSVHQMGASQPPSVSL